MSRLGPTLPMAALLLCVALPVRSDIICETKRDPVRVSKTIYVIEERTHCYHPEQTRVERLLSACNLLIAAYGQTEGQSRCQALLANTRDTSDIDTAFGE